MGSESKFIVPLARPLGAMLRIVMKLASDPNNPEILGFWDSGFADTTRAPASGAAVGLQPQRYNGGYIRANGLPELHFSLTYGTLKSLQP